MNFDKSKKLYEESVNFLPGGVDSPIRAFKPYPFFVEKAKGSKLFDVDGNEYIDYCLGYGPIIFGHANETIIKESIEQIELGTAYGVPSEKEIILAKEVINRVPCAEMVRFCNSGTEATMSAIRLARGVTKRNKIIKFEGAYHGAHDAVLVKSGSGMAGKPDSPGVPEDATKVITGFRLSKGGAQEYYNIVPDLVTFGKILGGGFPIGAIAGKKEYIEQFAPSGSIYQAGTFSGNPMSINGGIAAFKVLNDKFYKDLHDKGEYLRNGMSNILDDLKLDFQINGAESMTQVYFTEHEVYDYETAKLSDSEGFLKYFHKLLENGVFIAPSQFECCFLSGKHSKEDIDKTLEAMEIAFKEL